MGKSPDPDVDSYDYIIQKKVKCVGSLFSQER